MQREQGSGQGCLIRILLQFVPVCAQYIMIHRWGDPPQVDATVAEIQDSGTSVDRLTVLPGLWYQAGG